MFENLKKFSPEGNGGDPTPENCTHDCGSCPSGGSCGSFDPASLIAAANKHSNVGKIIAVVSGKGGVGKTLVTSLMATNMKRRGHEVGGNSKGRWQRRWYFPAAHFQWHQDDIGEQSP